MPDWPTHYILDADGDPQPEDDLMAWADWMESDSRSLAHDALPDGTKVSTVFLGLDQRHSLRSPPVLWETMIFGGPHAGYQERYVSQEDALAGHAKALALAHGLT